MSLRSIVAGLLGALVSPSGCAGLDPRQCELLEQAIEFVAENADPRLRFVPGYRDKLAPAVRRALEYLMSALGQLPEPIELSERAWGTDPYVNAFFATPRDVARLLGRSAELRRFFEDPAHAGVDQAFALLSMTMQERQVFGAQERDGMLQRDVAQVTVGFSEHRLVALGATSQGFRAEVGARCLGRLVDEAVTRILARQEQAADLAERRAWLGTKLRLLRVRRDHPDLLQEQHGPSAGEIKAVERELAQTAGSLTQARGSVATLDDYIVQVNAVLGDPQSHLTVSPLRLRINRMGVKLSGEAAAEAPELVLTRVAGRSGLERIVAVVRCLRAELPPKEDLFAQAQRYLT